MTGDDELWRARALSFGPAAALYDAVRPSYPAAAVAWALQPLDGAGRLVADIGAGTGIMTRLLLAAGCDVVAVEPDEAMRQRLVETTPGAEVLDGRAESIPLPDRSLDGAVAAQAYHWFDHGPAHAELARVLRSGGVFAAIWNDRDTAVPWLAQFSRIVEGERDGLGARPRHRQEAGGDDRGIASFGPRFREVEVARFRHSTRHTPQTLVQLLQSRSYYLKASPRRQRELVRDVLELTRSHPDLVGRDEFDLPYVTSVYRAVRR